MVLLTSASELAELALLPKKGEGGGGGGGGGCACDLSLRVDGGGGVVGVDFLVGVTSVIYPKVKIVARILKRVLLDSSACEKYVNIKYLAPSNIISKNYRNIQGHAM